MTRRLDNYLRTYRKRFSLSQDEVAFLLGVKSGTKVSRYERRSRQPKLETVLGYAVIFGVQGRTLFAGIFNEVEGAIIRRAQVLARKLSAARQTPVIERKLTLLRALTSGRTSEPANES